MTIMLSRAYWSSLRGLSMVLRVSFVLLVVLPIVEPHPQGARMAGARMARIMTRPGRAISIPFFNHNAINGVVNGLSKPIFRMAEADSKEDSTPEEESSSVEPWFRQRPLDPDTTSPEEQQALEDFLTGKVSAEVAAERITAAVVGSKSAELRLPRIWGLINDAAVDLPSEQEKLIDLLEAIQKLPDRGKGKKKINWSDLPWFANDIRDMWDVPENKDPPLRQVTPRPKWTNLNAFAARITNRGLINFKHMGIWSLREALERRISPNSIQVLDGAVPGAAQWILRAGRLIRESDEELGQIALGGTLFRNGKPGFSRERWEFWKARFRWVQNQQGLRKSTTDLARQAAEVMERLD